MRTFDVLLRAMVIGATFVAAPAFAFDGTKSDNAVPPGPVLAAPPASLAAPGLSAPGLAVPGRVMPATAYDAFRTGAKSLKSGDVEGGLEALRYAAEKDFAPAQWKLGRMYADGEGVARNDLKAFEYFSRVADNHADDNPDIPQARFVANAFVALGHYYLVGIPRAVERDPERAREMFNYAASYFRDPDAQYYLARLYLDGVGTPRDPRLAARWFGLSAHKGQCAAQAMLGAMLFTGDVIPRQAARGLMWLTIAKDSARAADQAWIGKLYDSAFSQASEDERAMAAVYLKRYMETRRD
jgi:TPR repeat protein